MIQNSKYYDKYYRTVKKTRWHYSKSKVYPVWKKIIKELKKRNIQFVHDMGCGSGQFGQMVENNGIEYRGFDFSKEAIKLAKEKGLDVWVGNLFNTVNYWRMAGTVFVCTEVLEHIKYDTRLLKTIPKNLIFISVPNFGHESHVRKFKTRKQVKERYQDYIDIESIEKIGRRFLMIGRIK